MKSALAFVRTVAFGAVLASAGLIASAPQAAAQGDDFWMELAIDQAQEDAGPGLVSSLIDYVSLRAAMEAKPGVIRARLAACGACKDRATLEHELAIADRDLAVISSLETLIAEEIFNVQPWEGWKRGMKIRPPGIKQQPPACIALYDRYMDCAVSHDDRYADSFGRACYSENRLQTLCAAGKAKPFYDYVAFLNRKERGDPVSETKDWSTMYYNVRPDAAFPQAAVDPQAPYFNAITDSKAAGALRSLYVTGLPLAGPGLAFSNPRDFRKPWDAIVQEDLAASGSGRMLECRYVQSGTNLLRSFLFWYRERPAGADPKYLAGRMADHPLLRVGAPLATCPVTRAKAEELNPIVETATLKARYGEKLRQPGDPADVRVRTPEEVKRSEDAAAERRKIRGQ
jgi:hypothetical protein